MCLKTKSSFVLLMQGSLAFVGMKCSSDVLQVNQALRVCVPVDLVYVEEGGEDGYPLDDEGEDGVVAAVLLHQ